MKNTFTRTKLYTKEIKALLTFNAGLLLIVKQLGPERTRSVRVNRVTIQEDIAQLQIAGREVPKFESRIHELSEVQLK